MAMFNNYGYYPQSFMQPQQQAPQQNNAFLTVRNEAEARGYPVAPGNSIMFRDENAPYIYNKSMGYSQLDQPTFDKYRLVKENVPEMHEDDSKTDLNNQTVNLSDYALKSDIDALTYEINALKEKVSMLSEKETPKNEQ